jgi:hypothetical protein
MREFIALAWQTDVRTRALRVAAVVGSLLVLINQSDAVVSGQLTTDQFLQILLTYCVPYGVSTYSSVKALRLGSDLSQQPEQN